MSGAFAGCTSLETVPIISQNVFNIKNLFDGCTSLTGTINIDGYFYENNAGDCFKDTVKPIVLTGGSVETLEYLASTANNGNVTV